MIEMIFQLAFIDPKSIIATLDTTITKIAFAVLTFFLGFIIGRVLGRIVYKALNEIELNKFIKETTGAKINADHLISNILSYVIYLFSFVAALEQLGIAEFMIYAISTIIVIVVVISFFLAVRDFIPNFIAGIALYRRERIKRGSYVEIADIKGKLLHIDLFQIKIETKSGDIIYLPNSTAIKSKIKIRKRKPS